MRAFLLSAAVGIAIAAIAVVFFVTPRRTRIVISTPSPLSVSSLYTPEPLEEISPNPPLDATSVPKTVNPLTGEACNHALRRPMAVMLSGDAIARPLSGIAEADMVFEMPVITGSITRFMAIFICRDPIEIGSVRSARHDFIPLARGFDAIYVHWGGSHFALDMLKAGAIDNIDALINPTGAFWRKSAAPAPHNGFTSMTRLDKAAQFLQYRLAGEVPAYTHATSTEAMAGGGSLEIGYPGAFRVRYVYDPQTRTYTRIRGGITERDQNAAEAVQTRNVVIVRAASKQIEGQYNDVVLDGTGQATVYHSGLEIAGSWHKSADDAASPLRFILTDGSSIPLARGKIWVQIVEPCTDVQWIPQET